MTTLNNCYKSRWCFSAKILFVQRIEKAPAVITKGFPKVGGAKVKRFPKRADAKEKKDFRKPLVVV